MWMAANVQVSTADLHDVARLIRLYLSSKSLVALGGVGVAALLQVSRFGRRFR